jgi:hypothetical protein
LPCAVPGLHRLFLAVLAFTRFACDLAVQQTDDSGIRKPLETVIENKRLARLIRWTFLEQSFAEGFDAVSNLLKSQAQK